MELFLIYMLSAFALGISIFIYQGQKAMALTLTDIQNQIGEIPGLVAAELNEINGKIDTLTLAIQGKLTDEEQAQLRAISENIAAAKGSIESMSDALHGDDGVAPLAGPDLGDPLPNNTLTETIFPDTSDADNS